MTTPISICIIKYGSSVFRTTDDAPAVAADIARQLTGFEVVVAVVSAFVDRTTQLIKLASSESLTRESPAYAKLLSAGAYESAAALLRALNDLSVPAVIATARRIGFVAEGSRDDADPKFLDRDAITGLLSRDPVLIVPGFSAVDRDGEPILLGPGGGDLSAVHLAARLGLKSVRLVKDIDGVFDRDPNDNKSARKLLRLDYDMALDVASKRIQPKALRYAAAVNVAIEVAALGEEPSAIIAG